MRWRGYEYKGKRQRRWIPDQVGDDRMGKDDNTEFPIKDVGNSGKGAEKKRSISRLFPFGKNPRPYKGNYILNGFGSSINLVHALTLDTLRRLDRSHHLHLRSPRLQVCPSISDTHHAPLVGPF